MRAAPSSGHMTAGQVAGYLDDVGRMAEAQRHPVVSVLVFGSVAVAGPASASDVDLVVVLADDATRAAIRAVGLELASLEVRHGLRAPESSGTWLQATCDQKLGGWKSVTVCRRRDLLSGDVGAIFGLSRLSRSLFGSTYRFCLAAVATTARTVWGEECVRQIPAPRMGVSTLRENLLLHLLRNACALAGYGVLPSATRYSRSILKGFVHDCHYVCTSRFATVEQEVEFFRARLGSLAVLEELLSHSCRSRRSVAFTLRCFPALIRLYALTVRESRFPAAADRPAAEERGPGRARHLL